MNDPNGGDGTMRDDDGLPPEWLEAADGYHSPPETPVAEMWSGIEEALDGPLVLGSDEARVRRLRPAARRWLGPALAAAAALVVGIGVGRMSVPEEDGRTAGSAVSPPEGARRAATGSVSTAVRTVALEHLGRSESLLTLVRADARAGRVDTEVGEWGRGLLAETRLLLDSPAADDPTLRELLRDLELILAQVALLEGVEGVGDVEGDHLRAELDIVARGLEEKDVLSRIRAVLPAGPETGETGI